VSFYKKLEQIEPLLAYLTSASDGTEYRAFYMEPGPNMTKEHVRHYFRVYTLGLLERSHLACITLLARSHRWIKASRSAEKHSNALGFAASLRGLLESAADGFDVMQYLPSTLEEAFDQLYVILHSDAGYEFTPLIMTAFEERLIHYAFATRQSRGSAPLPNHTAKTNAEYIGELEKFGVPLAKALYADLCALTHPSAESVTCFVEETESSMTFVAEKDRQVIANLMSKYEDCIDSLIDLSLTPALIGLAYLRRLNFEWTAPSDSIISGFGNTGEILRKMDDFIGRNQRVVVQ
jgi:hypothetical protein